MKYSNCLINFIILVIIFYFLFAVLKFLFVPLLFIVALVLVYKLGKSAYKKYKCSQPEYLELIFSILGYLSTRVSADKFTTLKTVDNVIASLQLNSEQSNQARNCFDIGESYSEKQIQDVIDKNEKNLRSISDKIQVLSYWSTAFFNDAVFTKEEQKLFLIFANKIGFSNAEATKIMGACCEKNHFYYDQSTGNYTSNFDFRSFFSRFGFNFDQGNFGGQNNYYDYGNNSQSSSSNGYGYNSETELQTAYKILDIDENTSDTDAKRAYLRLMKRYHPDRTQNLSEQEQKRYNEMCQQIQASWEVVKKYRHIR